MKFLLVLLITVVCFVFEANAQLCGKYSTTLKITDEAGKSIENTKIQITPAGSENFIFGGGFTRAKDDAARYSITFNEGNIVRGKYKIEAVAPGFSPAEMELGFPHCASRVFEVVLKPENGIAKSEFRQLIKIRGEMFDEKGRIGSSELTVTDDKGKTFKTKAERDGYYNLELPFGNYSILYQKAGYKTLKLVNVEIKSQKNIYLYSVKLESIRDNEQDTLVIKEYKDLYKSVDVY